MKVLPNNQKEEDPVNRKHLGSYLLKNKNIIK